MIFRLCVSPRANAAQDSAHRYLDRRYGELKVLDLGFGYIGWNIFATIATLSRQM